MYSMVSAAAEHVPSEIDYINENWTLYEIARHYALKVARHAPPA